MTAAALILGLALQIEVSAQLTPPSPGATAAFERGRRLWELGSDLPAAKRALDEAIQLHPGYGEAYLYRALVVSHDAGLAPARADFDMAMKLAPSKEAHRFYGEALADAGEIAAAEEHYKAALAEDPKYAEVMYLHAKLERKRGNLDRAIALLEQHAVLEPKGTAHHVLGEIFLEKGDNARAARELELDLATDESCYESRINLAGLRLEAGQYDAARQQYETSLSYHPADARALSGLGRAYLALGDYERAVGTLRSARDLSPDDAQVAEALATARSKLRLRYGWPFAVIPTALALGLAAWIVVDRRRRAKPERKS